MKRTPLWLTLVPLLAAIGLYGLLWRGWAADFEGELRGWLPGSTLSVGGFPYRLEAEARNPRLSGGGAVRLTATAEAARINRGPWQPELTVIQTRKPDFTAMVSDALAVRVTGATAVSSVNVVDGRVLRLSTVLQSVNVRIGAGPLPIAADTLEVHLRELPGETVPATAPTAAPRGQLVLAGTRLRFAGGDALTMAADIAATAAARLADYDRWASGGTLELRSFKLSDAHGEIATARATLTPRGRAGMIAAGTIDTICPAAVVALFTGTPALPEKRLRVPVRLVFEGPETALRLAAVPDLANRPRRSQLPNCPKLRG